MFRSVAYTWELMGLSWAVLRENKDLLWFPFMSGLGVAALLTLLMYFLRPLMESNDWALRNNLTLSEFLTFLTLLFLFFLFSVFFTVFFNTALAACAVEDMRGEPAGFFYGLGEARSRLNLIVWWTLFTVCLGAFLFVINMIVGVIVGVLSNDRLEKVDNYADDAARIGFNLASFFMIPMFVLNSELSLTEIFDKSKALFTKTWGKQGLSQFSFFGLSLLLYLPAVVFIAVTIAEYDTLRKVALGYGILAFIYIMAVSLIISTLHMIFRIALYLYVTNGFVSKEFGQDSLQRAIQPR